MTSKSTLAVVCLLAVSSVVAIAASAPPPILDPRPGQEPWQEALDWAFVFASSLQADRNDMGKAQQAATLAYAEKGDIALAAERAALISGWRRSVVYAELAGKAARAGETSTARALTGKAEAFAATVGGWQRKRIDAHIANALALLGDLDSTERMAGDLAINDPRQYTGRAVAAVAVGHATRGEFDQAMTQLATLDATRDFDVSWWRTLGYLEVSRTTGLDDAQRLQALAQASNSADGVDGWKSAEGKLEVAGDYLDMGQQEPAAAAIAAAETAILAFGDHNPVKPAYLGRLAELRQRLGQKDQARKLLAAAVELVPSQLIIDIPGIYAALGASYRAIDDPGEAAAIFDKAMDAALELENSRPRALAMTSVCVQLGRSETVLDADTRTRLRRIYAGLGDPW